MNARVDPAEFQDVTMTMQGDVRVPESVRRAGGLAPGAPMVIGVNSDGQVVLMTRVQAQRLGETVEERRTRIEAALNRMRGTVDTGFATTDAYMDFIRPHRKEDW